jgi:hypothetical protein
MPDIITLAWIVGGLFLLAASLKALRNLARTLLAGTLRAGDATASHPAGKRKAPLLILAVLALFSVGGHAGMWLFPNAAETPLLPPESDDEALERLQSELDTLHAAGVAREVKTINAPPTRHVVVGRTNDWLGQPIFREVPNRRADYRQYRSYAHKAFTSAPVPSLASVTVAYHRNCAVCDRTFNARLKIDRILRQRQAKARPASAETEPRLRAGSRDNPPQIPTGLQ